MVFANQNSNCYNNVLSMKSLLLFLLTASLLSAHTFEVSYTVPAKKPVYTPRVYIAISQGFSSPRTRMADFAKLPILFAVDDHDRDGKVTINEKSIATVKLADLEGRYKIQAVVRIQPDWFLPGVAWVTYIARLSAWSSSKVKNKTLPSCRILLSLSRSLEMKVLFRIIISRVIC